MAKDMGVPIEEIRARCIGAGVAVRLDAEILRMRAGGIRVLSCDRYARPYYVAGRGTSALQSPGVLRTEIRGQAWTQAEHDAAARAWIEVAERLTRGWQSRVTFARAAFGDHGALVSGVDRDHYPGDVKDVLRELARARAFAEDASLAHWIGGAGRRSATWRQMRAAVQDARAGV